MMGKIDGIDPRPWPERSGARATPAWVRSLRVLVVDDEKPFARRLSRAFEEAGFQVETAFEGAAALRSLQGSEFDLVVLDYRMPSPDGGAVLRRLRESGNRVPVLFVTGDITPEPESAALAHEDCYVVRKPCQFEEIVKSARFFLGARPERA